MVKIIAMSDTHFDTDAIQPGECDILIHSGDFLGHGTVVEFVSFIADMRDKIKYKNAILVPGNHDWACQDTYDVCKGTLNENEFLLTHDTISLMGLTFHGCSYTPIFYTWAFMRSEKELKYIFKDIPLNIDVLITHGPAIHMLDKNASGESCGSRALRARIREVKPRYHIFGHIHQNYGRKKYAGTEYINVSLLNDNYELVNKPVVIEI